MTSPLRPVAQTLPLGLNLLRYGLKKESDPNLLYSPLTLTLALGMTANGMRGDTYEQTTSALGLDNYGGDRKATTNDLYRTLLGYLTPDQLGVTLAIAQGIWHDSKVPIRPAFLQTSKEVFSSAVRPGDFGNPEYVLNNPGDGTDSDPNEGINAWTKRKTNGLIDKILEELSSDAFMVLVSALFFEGPWTEKFPLYLTEDKDFRDVGKLPIMFSQSIYRYVETDSYQLIAKPFAEQQRLNKVVLLPKDGHTVESVVAELKPSDIWALIHAESIYGNFLYPRNKVASKYNLIPALQSLGMSLPFAGGDFGDLADGNIYISQIVQKNVGIYHELGGKAASATAVETCFECCIAPPEPQFTFEATKPYVELLVDFASGAVLFIGVTRVPEPVEAPVDEEVTVEEVDYEDYAGGGKPEVLEG